MNKEEYINIVKNTCRNCKKPGFCIYASNNDEMLCDIVYAEIRKRKEIKDE